MLTLIESGSNAWAVAATNGDLRIYSREQEGEWSELALGEDAERIDEDGTLILEALFQQSTGRGQDGAQAQAGEPEAEGDEPEGDEEPEGEEADEPEGEEEPEEDEPEMEADDEPDEDEEEKPKRRGRASSRRGRSSSRSR